MGPAERLVLAHRLAAEAAAQLKVGNDPASGHRLLMRAATTDFRALTDNVTSADYISRLAREVFETGGAN